MGSMAFVALILIHLSIFFVAIGAKDREGGSLDANGQSSAPLSGPPSPVFVSVSGWPQSGTSFLQQVLTVAPGFSTMVKACFQKRGIRCMNFNNEGQWLIDAPPHDSAKREAALVYGFGRMCEPPLPPDHPHPSPASGSMGAAPRGALIGGQVVATTVSDRLRPDGSMSVPSTAASRISSEMCERVQTRIVESWLGYWNESASYLVQKSPQDVLKTRLLRRSVRSRMPQQKYVIVIKHPGTVNTALPRLREWTLDRSRAVSSSGQRQQQQMRYGGGSSSTRALNGAEINENFDYFFDYMMKVTEFANHSVASRASPTSDLRIVNTSCNWPVDLASPRALQRTQFERVNLGWLPTMELLVEQLEIDYKFSSQNIRIVRFEDVALNPHYFCVKLFRFIMNGTSSASTVDEVLQKVCDKFMSEEAIAETMSRHRTRPSDSSSSLASRLTEAESRLRESRMPHHRRLSVNGSVDAPPSCDSASWNHSSLQVRRSLRLRRGPQGSGFLSDLLAQYSTLQFSRKIAVDSITSRLSMLVSALGTCSLGERRKAGRSYCDPNDIRSSKLNSENVKRLVYLDSRLSRFGYRLLCPPQSREAVSRLMAPREGRIGSIKKTFEPSESFGPMCYLSYLSVGSSSGDTESTGSASGRPDATQDAFAKWLL